MKRTFFYAPNPKQGGAVQPKANVANQQPAEKQVVKAEEVGDIMKVLDNFQMPARSFGGNRGAVGSKYLPEDVKATVEGLQVGQGFIAANIDGIEPVQHRKMLSLVFKNYYGDKGKALEDGQEPMKFSTAVVDAGIAVRRDA